MTIACKNNLTLPDLSKLAEKWPSAYVAREQVGNFSGGMMNSKTQANLDSLGKGCPRVRVGQKIVYRTDDLIKWLESRATACPDKKQPCTCGENCDCEK